MLPTIYILFILSMLPIITLSNTCKLLVDLVTFEKLCLRYFGKASPIGNTYG